MLGHSQVITKLLLKIKHLSSFNFIYSVVGLIFVFTDKKCSRLLHPVLHSKVESVILDSVKIS